MNPPFKCSKFLVSFIVLLSLIVAVILVVTLLGKYGKSAENASDIYDEPMLSTYDEPLFLTQYIENGDIETGRTLSRVGQLPNAPSVPSYSGFFTVNKEYNSNLFFWFFPALNNNVRAPVILWLQGGPGASGLLGLFVEHGPYELSSNTTAGLREYTWAKEFNVLYVDSPVAAGFSFTENEKGYATDQDQITNDLYTFLQQFFEVYYEYGHNDLYICGDSYGGKHVPYLGYKLHTDRPPANVNFRGISIGNGFIDIQFLQGHEEFLYQFALLDLEQANIVKNMYESVFQNVQKGEYLPAITDFNKCFGYFQYPENEDTTLREQFTAYTFSLNVLYTDEPEEYRYYNTYIQTPEARRSIHVGNLTFHGLYQVQKYLSADILASSSRDKLVSLMDHYKVLVYNGQLDLSIPYVLTETLLQNLTWNRSEEYRAADRKIWRLETEQDDVAGYVRSVKNFFGILVRNAGLLVAHDQPKVALDLITRFVNDVPYTE